MPETIGQRRNLFPRRILVIALCVALLLVLGVSATFAYEKINGGSSDFDSFVPAAVSCTVNSNTYKIKNTSNIPVYVRVRIIANWVDANGNIYGSLRAGHEFSYTDFGTRWKQPSSGNILYYNHPIAPDESTNAIFADVAAFKDQFTKKAVTSKAPASGLSVQIQIVAEAIQADGTTVGGVPAVQNAWSSAVSGVDADTGKLTLK